MTNQRTRPLLADVLRADIARLMAAFALPEGRSTLVYRVLSALLQEKRGRKRYRMRILYCPPLGLLRPEGPRDGSAAAFLHRFWRREVWRERGGLARLRLLAALLAWPAVVGLTAAWFTALHGRTVARRTGKGRLRQLAEQLRLAAAHDVLPPWYYVFELFDPALARRAGSYLHRFETKGGILRFVREAPRPGRERLTLSDKLRFADRCRERGLPCAPVLWVAEPGAPLRPAPGAPAERTDGDLFVKPAAGRGGLGVERWRALGDGRFRSDGGTVLRRADLLARVEELGRLAPVLVQPRLVNHPELADLCNGALSTVRVMTVADERGGCEVTHAVLRMALGAGRPVDNFHSGGIAAAVDLATGVLAAATDVGLRPDVGWRDFHPDTGARIRGRRLPYWEETLALSRRAHAAFPRWPVIGWDVAILADGPVLIEGNSGPDVDILQRCHREPLGDGRFGELLRFHVRRALAARGGGPPGLRPGPWRPGALRPARDRIPVGPTRA